jgi:hypothetical protein
VEICKIEGCNNKVQAREYCSKHYRRWYIHGDPNIVVNERPLWKYNGLKCLVEGCLNDAKLRKYCIKHYEKWKRYGNPTERNRSFGREKDTTIKATKSPTLKDIYWVAGFCEGEATFNRSSVHLNQTQCREPLQRMLDLYGGNINPIDNSKQRLTGIKARDAEEWRIYGSRARGFMMTIYPLMSPKRQKQIRRALGVK